jgi:hypothetical protein
VRPAAAPPDARAARAQTDAEWRASLPPCARDPQIVTAGGCNPPPPPRPQEPEPPAPVRGRVMTTDQADGGAVVVIDVGQPSPVRADWVGVFTDGPGAGDHDLAGGELTIRKVQRDGRVIVAFVKGAGKVLPSTTVRFSAPQRP